MLLSGLADFYQVGLLKGIEEAARASGVSLLCFLGGTLPADPAAGGARHRVYDLCGPHTVDGVILLASTISHEVGPPELARLCEKYRPLPIISVGAEFEGAAAVTVDNHAGMHGAICHLIEAHGARRIAFVCGPSANAEAELRLNAYRTALEKHGIAFEPTLVLAGDFGTESGASAARRLIDLRGPQLDGVDAIAAANDCMAVGVLSVLEERGINVPRRIAVVGFDDVEEGRLKRPPLTTVRQPLEKVGRQALRSFLDSVQFHEKPAGAKLDTDLVVRRSCGCGGSKSPARATRGAEQRLSVDAALMVRRQDIMDSLTRVAHGSFGAAGADWQARLFNAVAADAREPDSSALVVALQDLMDKISSRGLGVELCDELLSTLRRQVLEAVGEYAVPRARLEDSFHSARVAISETLRHNLARGHLELSGWARTLSEACSIISSAFDANKLARHLREELPRLGIQCCSVVLYDRDPSSGLSRSFCGYDLRSGQHWHGGAKMSVKALIAPELMNAREGRSFVVLPIFWESRRYGHVLMELNVDHGFGYWPIAEAISTAVRGAELVTHVRFESTRPAAMVPAS